MKNRSIALTAVLIKTAFVMCFISLFLMPFFAQQYKMFSFQSGDVTVPLLATFYSCAAAGFAILFGLDKLIGNIKNGRIFIEQNVKILRIISYCCFIIAFITLLFARLRIYSFVITFAGAFMGLIIRVIKNCFEGAVKLREENDFTV